jgi:tryptophan halogenase
VEKYTQGLFLEPSWIAVYVGQGIVPEAWDQRADAFDAPALGAAMDRLRGRIAHAVKTMPDHAAFIARRNASIETAAR